MMVIHEAVCFTESCNTYYTNYAGSSTVTSSHRRVRRPALSNLAAD